MVLGDGRGRGRDDGDAGRHREALVDRLVAAGTITDPRVERAMRVVPRDRLIDTIYLTVGETNPRPKIRRLPEHTVTEHRLVDEPHLVRLAYEDRALCVRMDDGEVVSTTSQPGLIAQMLQLLDVREGMSVLEVGTGIGYTAALLAELVGPEGSVTTVDIDEPVTALARERLAATGYGRVDVVTADGAAGVPGRTFDRIIATVGCPDVPAAWVEQLRPGGVVLVPVQHGGMAPIMRLVAEPGALRGRALVGAGFIPLRGELEGPSWWHDPPPRPSRSVLGSTVPLPPAAAVRLRDDAAARAGLGYFLSVVDRRMSWTGTFHDGGRTVQVDFGAAVVHADPGAEPLAAELVAHVERWAALGGPAMDGLVSLFVPQGSAADVVRSDGDVVGVIERPVHRQIVVVPA